MAPDRGYAALPDSPGPPPPHVPGGSDVTAHAVAERWALPGLPERARQQLADPLSLHESDVYARTIENFIGTVRVPVGLAGPLRVNGRHRRGDYYIPLATTEATLVASYSRGAQLLTEAGGCSSVVLAEGVSRAPAFAFDTILDAARLLSGARARSTPCARLPRDHAIRLIDERAAGRRRKSRLPGASVFQTADAAGQNMVTIAAEAICRDIAATIACLRAALVRRGQPVRRQEGHHAIPSGVRGRRVSAEVVLPAPIWSNAVCIPPSMCSWATGARRRRRRHERHVGVQGHYANGLAAMYIACGQDVACVAEVGGRRHAVRAHG